MMTFYRYSYQCDNRTRIASELYVAITAIAAEIRLNRRCWWPFNEKNSHSHPCNWTWKLSAFFRSIFDRIPFIFRSFSSSDFSYLSNFINACSVFDMWMSCWLQWRAHKENDDHQTISITVKICCGKHWAQKKRKNGKKCEKKKAEAIDGEPALDYNNYN